MTTIRPATPGLADREAVHGMLRRMPTATWNGTVIAQSVETVVFENNHYFPRASVRAGALAEVR